MADRVGVSYTRLVPASLLPPEDPSRSSRRTLRDWTVDVVLFLFALGVGALFLFGSRADGTDPSGDGVWLVDGVLGVVGCLALWARRRHPAGVGLGTALLAAYSLSAAPASIVALFGAAVHRRSSVAVAVAAVNLATASLVTVLRPQPMSFWVSSVVNVAVAALLTAWGMFVRSRRQLVWTLRERAERAEAEQRLLAERARRAERTRIAREMHDVLAHRISLVALHAGGLELRPDLPAEQVRETAGLLRTTARQALEELRGVIGVLRDPEGDAERDGDTDAPAAPQPTLEDIPRLVDDTRRAGARVELHLDVPDGTAPPAALGRDAYRIVQEALTNVAKHAGGTATRVAVTGAPGDGLVIDVRNRLPVAALTAASLPGSGSGLVGLRERVDLSGGELAHGATPDGDFAVTARLPWPLAER